MSRPYLLLIAPLLGPIVVLTGLWRPPSSLGALSAESLFVAETVPLDQNLIGSQTSGEQLLDAALAQLAPERLAWLRTELWQRMSDRKTVFEAEGRLDLGPGQCARLDLTVRTPDGKGRLLTISDGRALARVLQFGATDPVAVSELLPDNADPQFLDAKGCGGPRTVLAGLRRQLRDIRLQTGRLAAHAVIQVKGELGPDAIPDALQTSSPIRHAYLYLDARTLWPHRVEWWSSGELTVALEFRAAELNRPRDLDECAALFSYEPFSPRP